MREHVPRLCAGFRARVVLAVVAATLAAGCAAAPAQHMTAGGAPVLPGIPRYYVALESKGPVSTFPEPLAAATVRVTATGALIARISAPRPYVGFTAVTGAADDRTFVLLAHARTDPFTGDIPERFFLLRIDPGAPSDTARARLTALSIRDLPSHEPAGNSFLGEQVATITLSPNGRSLAAILTVGGQNRVYIYNLATGKTRSWVWNGCRNCDPVALSNPLSLNPGIPALSWTADGRSVAFTLMYVFPIMTQLRLLHLSAPGNDVFVDSSPITVHAPAAFWRQAVMTPDGKTVLLHLNVPSGGMFDSPSLVRFSSATGRVATINTLPMIETGGYANVGPLSADTILWTNADGGKLVIADARPGHTLGIYSGDTYTPLPWPAHAVGAAW